MGIRFPSLEFFQALQQKIKDDPEFEKLGVCDTTFGVRVGDALFSLHFEVYECVDVREGGDPSELDFVITGPVDAWREMVDAIIEHGGADAAHTLNSLTHLGDVIQVEYEDPEGHDRLYRFMASIQAFFDQARHLEID
ncbi:MAG: hypothetical protein JRG82_12160 [Deltaproteobacteria bacterium]|nr:hypothetical protein [Deltaproteobacteria bacterium]